MTLIHIFGAILIFTIAIAHEATFWKNENFIGPKLHYVNFEIDKCVNFFKKWPHDVSWLDTHGICLEVWTEDDCQGDVRYILSSNPTYSKLPSVRIKSFKTCQTTKVYRDQVIHKALDENRVEHRFWQVCFRVLGLENHYQKQVDRQGRFIDWNFILRTREPRGRREQYDELLDQVIKRFRHFSKSMLNTTNYNLEDFRLVAHLAAGVVRSRTKVLQDHPANDTKYESHQKIIVLWEQLNEAINDAFKHLQRYITKQKWDARRAVEELPGFHVFLRIVAPKDISWY